jgi:heme A synthase
LLFVFALLCGVIIWTTRKSFKLRKEESPKLWLLFLIAFLQILLGMIVVLVVKWINNNPVLAFGSGLVALILSGWFWIKIFLKQSWKQSLRLWKYAAGMQLILLPICAAGVSIIWLMLTFMLFPPLL